MKRILQISLGIVLAVTILWVIELAVVTTAVSWMFDSISQISADAQAKQIEKVKLAQMQKEAELARILDETRRAEERRLAKERMFVDSYTPPAGCDDYKSDQHMVQSVNHRIQARRAFDES